MKGETILCVATRRWNSLWRDSQQIMSRISTQNRVLYFEPGRNPDRPLLDEMKRNLPNYWGFRADSLNENLVVIPTPSSLPYARRHLPRAVLRVWTPFVAKVNARTLVQKIQRAMRVFNVSEPILWVYEPRDIDLLGKFGEKIVCYYNYDEFPEFVQNRRIRDLLRDYDNRMSSRADVVLTTSRGQWERRKRLNPNTHFIPNGVDFDLFSRSLDPSTHIPPEIAGLKRPIIGFAGWLGYQVDVDLLIYVARQCADCTVLLVGPDNLPDDDKHRELHGLPNVVFTGKKELHELPAYLKVFDAALIPYVIKGHTLTVYPLKLHEYLAAGRAVVATALPELRAFAHIIRVADHYDHYVDQVRAALRDNGPQAIAARVAIARQNTWDQRVEDIYAAINRHPAMAAKGGRVENQLHRLDALRPSP